MKMFRAFSVLACLCMVGPMAVSMRGAETKAHPKPGSGSAVANAEAEKKIEIPGLEIARPNGTFLGLQVVNSNFVLTFYDAEKKKMPVDVQRATLRWPVKYQPADERAVLNPAPDGTSLTSAATVRPPHRFKVFMGLFVEGTESAVENYVIDYRP